MTEVAWALVRTLRRPRWSRAYAFWFLQYRRTWRGSILSTFVYPTLYLASLGLGLGGIIGRHVGAHAAALGGMSYLDFVAPGVLVAAAMQIGINEASWPVMSAVRWQRSYFAQVATPIRPTDALSGHLAWIATKLFATCAVFAGVSAAFGASRTAGAVVEVFAATLTGLAFATPMAAYAASLDSDAAFSTISRLVVVPLFLFSGTFFPIGELPVALRVVAPFTPLYHGVALCRSLVDGNAVRIANLGHLGYLCAMAAGGIVAARRSFAGRLYR